MYYAIILNASGVGTGVHTYAELPASYPANESPCTAAQAQNPAAWSLVNGALVESLSAAQAAQIASLSASCSTAITSGYTSSALGSSYLYPSDANSQMNMAASVIDSLYPGLASTWTTPFLVQNTSTGAWSWENHTASQIQAAGAAGKAAVLALRQQLASLIAQVNAATTVSAVQAVVWP